ncbi:MAG: hypothetical protein JWL59_4308 [Chthoniobacteraceae bacterium]|nr:hypothetical protein [Chthoniobacteraceae bacterium]
MSLNAAPPIPDPRESIVSSTLSTFRSLTDQNGQGWLPNLRIALHVKEEELDPIYELQASDFSSCPPNAAFISDVSLQAGRIAKWVFDTYSRLVQKRLDAYNKLRRKVNGTEPEQFLGQYRRTARLANEQILRRDLPLIPGLDWNFYQPLLPIFEIGIKFDIGTVGEAAETVLKMVVSGTVEVWQASVSSEASQVMLSSGFDDEDPNLPSESSSSSSSSSASSYFPPEY